MKNKGNKIGLPRIVFGNIFIAMLLVLITNISTVMLQRINTVALKESYRSIFYGELFIFGILALMVLDIRFDLFAWRKPIKGLKITVRIIVSLLSLLVVIASVMVVRPALSKTDEDTGYAIVLGMALENGIPSQDLMYRVDAAKGYLDRHPGSSLILTGGNSQNNKTEAEEMRDLLVEAGVDEGKLLLEDQAQTTLENFLNVAQMIDPHEQVVLITSNYHMARASKAAKKAGFENIAMLAAKSEIVTLPTNVLWEVVVGVHETISSFGK